MLKMIKSIGKSFVMRVYLLYTRISEGTRDYFGKEWDCLDPLRQNNPPSQMLTPMPTPVASNAPGSV